MSETLPEALRRLGPRLSVADKEVTAWPKYAKAYRVRAALLTDLASVAEAAGTEAAAVAIAARIGAASDTARAAELAVANRQAHEALDAKLLDRPRPR